MHIRHFALAIITIAALSPSISEAAPETESVNACARTLAAGVGGTGGFIPSYKLIYSGNRFTGSVADYFPGNSFELEAHDPKTHAVIARARCSTNYRGEVVAFSWAP